MTNSGQVNITLLTKISTCQSSSIGWRVHQTAQIAESFGQVNTTLLTKVAHIAKSIAVKLTYTYDSDLLDFLSENETFRC